jgi:hypothetical protein
MIGTAFGTCQGIARNFFSADRTYLRRPGSDAFLIGHGLFTVCSVKKAPAVANEDKLSER